MSNLVRRATLLFLIVAKSTSYHYSSLPRYYEKSKRTVHHENPITANSQFYLSFSNLQPICDDAYKQKYPLYNIEKPSEQERGFPIKGNWLGSSAINLHSSFEKLSSPEFLTHFPRFHTPLDKYDESSFDGGRCVWNDTSCHETQAIKRLYRNSKIIPKALTRPSWRYFNTLRNTFKGNNVTRVNTTSNANVTTSGWAENACLTMRRIVGGWNSQIREQYPYMVFVDTGCGGTIISTYWVITAAHCLTPVVPRYVHLGSLKLLGGCQYSIDRLFVHPNFKRTILRDDIGLLSVQPNFIFSPAIQPIKLSSIPAQYGMCGMVSGWGAKIFQGQSSMTMKTALIPVVKNEKCQMFDIKLGQFCAGYKSGEIDACQGDSGGPFIVEDFIVGIVSYGHKCAKPNTPGVYIDIFYYRDWIAAVAGVS